MAISSKFSINLDILEDISSAVVLLDILVGISWLQHPKNITLQQMLVSIKNWNIQPIASNFRYLLPLSSQNKDNDARNIQRMLHNHLCIYECLGYAHAKNGQYLRLEQAGTLHKFSLRPDISLGLTH